jgi:hypothetical protein
MLRARHVHACLTLSAALFALAASSVLHAAPRTVHALDIDRIGPAALQDVRLDPRVHSFVELGDRALVEADADFIQAQQDAGRWLASRVLQPGEVLQVHRRIHCEPGDDARAPDAFGAQSRWHVTVAAAAAPSPDAGKRLQGSDTIAWQAANRPVPPAAKADDAALTAIAAAVDVSRWRETVDALARYDRESAAGYNAALALVMDRFAALGLQPRRECFQSPDGRFNQDGRSCNVVAEQRGSGDDLVIVGAHLDARNASFNDALPSPGAEDNASGCAGVLEVARVLASRRPQASIEYRCYGLEERGLFGSRAHADGLATPARVRGVLNLDMIAFDGDGRLDASIETQTAGRALLDHLAPLAARYTLLEAEFGVQTCCSDHMPYLGRSIPAVLLIANDWDAYPQYHTSNDTSDRLSDAMARELVKLTAVGAASLAGQVSALLDAAGYWYDPTRDGQGWHFEPLPGGRIVATWYTFDASGARLWIVANGSVVDGVAKLDAFVAEGGVFPPAIGSGAVRSEPWGELRFRFDDCDRGSVEWTPRTETGLIAGTAQIQRLTPATSGVCAAN